MGCLTSDLGHVWTAPWQELSDVSAALVGCGHVSGLLMRRVWPLALMLCADRVPNKNAHFRSGYRIGPFGLCPVYPMRVRLAGCRGPADRRQRSVIRTDGLILHAVLMFRTVELVEPSDVRWRRILIRLKILGGCKWQPS